MFRVATVGTLGTYVPHWLNFDGANIWGRTRDVASVGYGRSTLDRWAGEAVARQGRVLGDERFPERGSFYRSGQFNFARAGIPVLYLRSGTEFIDRPPDWGRAQVDAWIAQHYHQPSDDFDPNWNFDGMVEDTRLNFAIGYALAQSDEMPAWLPGDEFHRLISERLSLMRLARRLVRISCKMRRSTQDRTAGVLHRSAPLRSFTRCIPPAERQTAKWGRDECAATGAARTCAANAAGSRPGWWSACVGSGQSWALGEGKVTWVTWGWRRPPGPTMRPSAALSRAVDTGIRRARLATPTTVEGRRRLNSN